MKWKIRKIGPHWQVFDPCGRDRGGWLTFDYAIQYIQKICQAVQDEQKAHSKWVLL